MTDGTQAITAVEEKAQPEATPTSEQKVPEPARQEQEAPPGATKPEETGNGLAQGVSARTTEQFEKLRNKLRLANERAEKAELLNSQPKTPPKQVTEKDYVDPSTGMVNVEKFNKVINTAAKQADEAKKAVTEQRQEAEKKEEQEAYNKFPELKTDPKLRAKTRALVYDSMVNPQDYGKTPGQRLSLEEAIMEVQGKGDNTKAKADASVASKQQASLQTPNRSDQNRVPADAVAQNDLAVRTRQGDSSAIAERMKSIPWKKTVASTI